MGVDVKEKKNLSLEEAIFKTLGESGDIALKSINDMQKLLRDEVNKK